VKKISIADLALILNSGLVFRGSSLDSQITGHESRLITGVNTDSRTVKTGDCFFAIAGENFDGHEYVDEAFGKGAVCAVVQNSSSFTVQRSVTQNPERRTQHEKCIIKVDDTIKALGDFACEYRKKAGYKVVAITGSVGKTTTRQITHHVLSQHFKAHQSPKSFNNNIGVPFTLLNAPADTEIVIAELGSNHPGEIAYLTRIAAPDIAVVTNVHPAHLEGFGSLDSIVKEKMSISEGLQPDGVMIINSGYNQLTDFCKKNNLKFVSFGKAKTSESRMEKISFYGSAAIFTIEDVDVTLPLPGPGNVENALASWTICKQFGLSAREFASAVRSFTGTVMRAEMLQIGTLTVLNDCYNANPASMKNALEILARIDPSGQRRLVFICGDMAELGQYSETLHTELGMQIAKAGVDLMLSVGRLSKTAAKAAKANAKKKLQTKSFEDTLTACNKLHEFIKDYDIILVKGSRTARLEAAVDKLKELFSQNVSPVME
jgi:UDP-N-acetylmuramoyl-tripeptide--D-alanyl-D-alanine ligase